jgi:hypothetical protein
VAVDGLFTTSGNTEIPLVVGSKVIAISQDGASAFLHPQVPLGSYAKYLYMSRSADALQGYATSVGLSQLHATHPALVFTSTPDQQPVIQGIEAADRAAGVTPAIVLQIPPDQASYGTEVQRLVAAHPDGIAYGLDAQTAGTFFANLTTAVGTIHFPLVGDETSTTKDFVTAVKPSLGVNTFEHWVYIVQIANANGPSVAGNPEATAVAQAWPSYNVGVPFSSAQVGPMHDIIILTALAMLKAHSTNPAAFEQYITQLTPPSGPLGSGVAKAYTFAQGVHDLTAGTPFVYWGVYGPLHWTPSHVITSDFVVAHWEPAPGGSGQPATAGTITISASQLQTNVAAG